MYTKLTKRIQIDERECVSCAFFGTERCHIHTDGTVDCGHCEVFAAILNQLNAFEDLLDDEQQ